MPLPVPLPLPGPMPRCAAFEVFRLLIEAARDGLDQKSMLQLKHSAGPRGAKPQRRNHSGKGKGTGKGTFRNSKKPPNSRLGLSLIPRTEQFA